MIPVAIVDLRRPPEPGFHFRLLLAFKLFLFAFLLPLLITLITHVFIALRAWYNDELVHSSEVFVADYLIWKPFWLSVAFFLMAGMTTFFLPFLLPLWIVPWTILCTITGFLLEVLIVIPRMFLGYFLDCFLFKRIHPDTPLLFPRPLTLTLAIILPLTAYLSSYAWPPLYPLLFPDHQPYDSVLHEYPEELQVKDRRFRQASAAVDLSILLDKATDANTPKEALEFLADAKTYLNNDAELYLTTHPVDFQLLQEAHFDLSRAIQQLSNLPDDKKKRPDQWRPNLSQTLMVIELYRENPTAPAPHHALHADDIATLTKLRDDHVHNLTQLTTVESALEELYSFKHNIDSAISDQGLKRHLFLVIKNSHKYLGLRAPDTYIRVTPGANQSLRDVNGLQATHWYTNWWRVHRKRLNDMTRWQPSPKQVPVP